MSEQTTSGTPTLIAGVRFSAVGKAYNFDATKLGNVKPGDMVLVETSRGLQLGEVVKLITNVEPTGDEPIKPITRLANPRDLLQRQNLHRREEQATAACRARAQELKLLGVKIVNAEYSFDGSRLSIMFSTDTEEKVDLKSLRQDMQRAFSPAQVELRQIGPRDVAKMMGGMGVCGLECRCCSRFLTEFNSISIRMAKEQNISLTPGEITGMCGRLRCCLIYEYDTYVKARAQLPKRNKRVYTPAGEGKIVEVFPLRDSAMVEVGDGVYREFTREEIQPADELDAVQKKAENPCPNPEDPDCPQIDKEGE